MLHFSNVVNDFFFFLHGFIDQRPESNSSIVKCYSSVTMRLTPLLTLQNLFKAVLSIGVVRFSNIFEKEISDVSQKSWG